MKKILFLLILAFAIPESKAQFITNPYRYVTVPYTPIFDAFPTNAVVGWSFRKLKTGATYSMRVRTAGGTTQDIGFVGNDFDIASFNTLCNATTCYCEIWYEQNGTGKDMTAETTGQQPEVAIHAGRLSLIFDGTDDYLRFIESSALNYPIPHTFYNVASILGGAASTSMIASSQSGTSNQGSGLDRGTGSGASMQLRMRSAGSNGTPGIVVGEGNWFISTSMYNNTSSTLAVNAASPAAITITGPTPPLEEVDQFNVGARVRTTTPPLGQNFCNVALFEHIFYNTTANTLIHSAMNAGLLIY